MIKAIHLLLALCSSFACLAQFFQEQNCSTPLSEAIFGEVQDTVRTRGMADNYHTWEPGSIILVKFMAGGGKTLQDKVLQYAREWTKYANITFRLVPEDAGFSHIRIKLGKGHGHNSAVGTEASFRDQNEQTINFDTLFFADQDYYLDRVRKKDIKPPYTLSHLSDEMKNDPNHWNEKEMRRVVMHEFGHALGLLHEQSYPAIIKWKKTDSVYHYYRETQGWTRQQVDLNVFEAHSRFYTNGTRYDTSSIMHYSINSWETLDGYSVQNNYELSEGDKSLIAALYPKTNTSNYKLVPKVNISKFTKLEVKFDTARQGLAIRPSFELKTNAKLGEVYFVARIANEKGYYLKTTNKYFNWGGAMAVFMKMNLLPNTRISYNKPTETDAANNLELFFPFRLYPDLYGKKLRVAFAVYLDDVTNQQLEKLMYFSATPPLSVPMPSH